MYLGQRAYAPVLLGNSFDYGPVYVFVLFALAKIVGAPFGIVTFRVISVAIGALSAIPFALCALLIAGRFGLPLTRRLAAVVAFVSVVLSLAILTRDMTFASLHPDALMAVLTATLLAVYYAIATRRLSNRFVWALLAVNLVGVFTKQNSALVFPLLVAALALTGAVRWYWAVAAVAAFVGIVVAGFAVMPPDMRAWTLLIPGAHGYEFTQPARAAALLRDVFLRQFYVAAELIVVALVSVLLARREGARAYIIDGAAALAVIAAAILAYFKVLGGWNNLTAIELFSAPYCAALVAPLVSVRIVAKAPWQLTVAATVLLTCVGLGINVSEPFAVANTEVRAQMTAIQAEAKALCAEGKPVLALAVPDMFLDCPTARLFPMVAYLEEEYARSGFAAGLYVVDRPPAFPRVVDMDLFPIPRRWQRFYRVIRTYPAVFGFGNYYNFEHLRVWALR
jgi:hypothetical protein